MHEDYKNIPLEAMEDTLSKEETRDLLQPLLDQLETMPVNSLVIIQNGSGEIFHSTHKLDDVEGSAYWTFYPIVMAAAMELLAPAERSVLAQLSDLFAARIGQHEEAKKSFN